MESELDYLKRLKDGIEARMAELEGDGQDTLAPKSDVEISIGSLTWKKNSYGEWAFGKTREGGLTPEAVPLLDAIHAANGKLTFGKLLYTVSDDGKFISRRALKK